MNIPLQVSVPANSNVANTTSDAYFYDAWKINSILPELDPLDQFLRVLSTTPRWVDFLMVLRNHIARLFGLKNLGKLSDIDLCKPSSEYKIGERVGIFTLIDKNEHEALLGDNDKHLKVIVSIHKNLEPLNGKVQVTVSTIVHIKSWVGRLYMLPVKPAHHIIARSMTKIIGNAI
ncbi:DUF2867 domain-containing protein [Psychromonas sp. GE-S-Ul-11]|jgi:hypothetical protein|uniref:DUF2867 domain-containing protein n=1 Tax=unclassified Psychromonas TaxID=2614957 RepID=UPI00390CCD81